MWATEDFTRIIIGRFEFATTESLDFVVSFQPMKPTYENRNQLKSLVLPIIQEEWNFTSRMYGLNNTAVGEIQLVQWDPPELSPWTDAQRFALAWLIFFSHFSVFFLAENYHTYSQGRIFYYFHFFLILTVFSFKILSILIILFVF